MGHRFRPEHVRRQIRALVLMARFASAVLLRPAQIQKVDKVDTTEKSQYELQVAAKAQLKALLESERLIPRVS